MVRMELALILYKSLYENFTLFNRYKKSIQTRKKNQQTTNYNHCKKCAQYKKKTKNYSLCIHLIKLFPPRTVSLLYVYKICMYCT